MPVEQRREAIYVKLRILGGEAIPALQLGLTRPDVQIRRNVALYLSFEGGNYAKHAAAALDVTPFLPQLVVALRDGDELVTARRRRRSRTPGRRQRSQWRICSACSGTAVRHPHRRVHRTRRHRSRRTRRIACPPSGAPGSTRTSGTSRSGRSRRSSGRSLDPGASRFRRTRTSVSRSQPGELPLAVDLCQVAAGVVVAASLAARESEAGARSRRRRRRRTGGRSPRGPAAVAATRPPAVARNDARDVTIQQRGGHLHRMTGHHAGVERVEPARVQVVPGAVLDDDVVVDAIAPGLCERSIGDLEHPDGARRRPVPLERVPAEAPPPVGPCYRVAAALDLGQSGQQLGVTTAVGARRRADRIPATSAPAPWQASR